MKVYTPPNKIGYTRFNGSVSIFLAGTIDMGDSENWQDQVIEKLTIKETADTHFTVFNPRREKWDNTIVQKFEDPTFFQQVSWELSAMDRAEIIIMNFLPESKSPISLLELGLHANHDKLRVCCPDEFYRSGNVQIVCHHYDIPLYKTMEELLEEI